MDSRYYPIIIYSMLFGVAIGSFINAAVYRLKHHLKIAKERSMCPNCKHKLGAKDLVPILSYIALKGRCRYCKAKISIQYPLVEALTSILFAVTTYRSILFYENYKKYTYAPTPALLFGLLALSITAVIIFIAVYDIKYQIIPNRSIILGIILTIAYLITQNFYFYIHNSPALSKVYEIYGINIMNALLGAIVGFGLLFLIVAATSGKGMGMGDVKLAFLMGLILGFPKILIALYIAIIIGAVFGIVAIARKKASMKSAIPFGPFLVLGLYITMLWGNEILDLINNLFLNRSYVL